MGRMAEVLRDDTFRLYGLFPHMWLNGALSSSSHHVRGRLS
jgi:hypothetical protein